MGRFSTRSAPNPKPKRRSTSKPSPATTSTTSTAPSTRSKNPSSPETVFFQQSKPPKQEQSVGSEGTDENPRSPQRSPEEDKIEDITVGAKGLKLVMKDAAKAQARNAPLKNPQALTPRARMLELSKMEKGFELKVYRRSKSQRSIKTGGKSGNVSSRNELK